MFNAKAIFTSVVEQGRRVVLQATRSKINPPGRNNHLKLSEPQSKTGVGRPEPNGVKSNQHSVSEAYNSSASNSVSLISSGGGIVNFLRPITSRIVQGLARRVPSPLWAEARKKSAKRLFGETAPYFALVGVTLVSGPERGLLTAQDELEAICGDIREAISRAGWIHNPNFWIPKDECSESSSNAESSSSKAFSLSNFDVGAPISKGCNAVVYESRWKEEDKNEIEAEEGCDSLSTKLATNPPQLVESLGDIFTNGSLWSLEQIKSNSGAISKKVPSATQDPFRPDSSSSNTDDEKTLSEGGTEGSPSDSSTEEEDLSFGASRIKSVASSAEDFFNLREGFIQPAVDSIGLHSSRPGLGLALSTRHSVSLSEDVDLLLSTGGFQRSKGKSVQKRKKVKFKVAEPQPSANADDNQPNSRARADPQIEAASASPSSIEDFPLAMKMMFNYEAESNAPAILTAMYKEMLPAKSIQLDDVSSLWKERLLDSTLTLPPHANIVEMPCVFVDRVPLLADGLSMYPDALPKRINPSGYGRNMSLFCVMKRYDCTVAEFLRERSPSLRTSLLLFTQLLEALNHLHRYNVSHRDLKSDNLLLCLREGAESPHLVVSDFGCCLHQSGLRVSFPSYEVDPRVGNAALMPPEIKSASPGLFTWLNYSKADLWSAGTLAYELFGLENPFAPRGGRGLGQVPQVMLDSATYKESQLPRLPKSFPAEVRCLIQALLKRNPNQRPSPTIAATVCQLSLWGPRKWLHRHALTMPSNNEVMRWLLCLSTKVLCEAGSSPPKSSSSKSGPSEAQGGSGGQLEYQIVSTFLKRVHYSDIIQAIKWVRAF